MGCNASKPQNVEPPPPPPSPPSPKKPKLPTRASGGSAMKAATPSSPQGPQDRQENQQQQQHSQYQNHRGGKATAAGSKLTVNGGTHDSSSAPPSSITTAPSQPTNVEAGVNDPQWRQLWAANKDILLDPMDVHAKLQDLMGEFTNKLSETELLFLQRKVRSVVRHSQLTAESSKSRKMRKNSSSAGSGSALSVFQDSAYDTKTVVKNYHLLTAYVLRRVLPSQPVCLRGGLALTKSPSFDSTKSLGSLASAENANGGSGNSSTPSIQIVETTYLLALYCNDSLWDRVAEIAMQSAKNNNLEMDVNQQQVLNGKQSASQQPVPEPCNPTFPKIAEAPSGVGLHALTFLLGVALRGTRQQQLNLLFYLLMPPKQLQQLLERHPGGGVPTWLFEVGQDSVISLASLSHYYWYGGGSTDAPFLPSSKNSSSKSRPAAWNKKQQNLAMTIPGREVVQFFMAILLPEAQAVSNGANDPSSPNENGISGSSNHGSGNSPNNSQTNTPMSPPKKISNRPFKRRTSQNNNTTEPLISDEIDMPQTELASRLQQQATAATNHTWTADSLNALGDFCTESSRGMFAEKASDWLKHHPATISNMTILDFDAFCKEALDDGCIAAIMHRIFAQGWIPTPSMELDIVKAKWREWQETSDGLAEWSSAIGQTADGTLEIVSQNVRKMLENGGVNRENSARKASKTTRPFGGLGGFDGQGGTGFGILYCIDRAWWDAWESYVGWSWAGDSAVASPSSSGERKRSMKRPGELSSNRLISRDDDHILGGTCGSYEFMRTDLKKDTDFVLVPPAVWDFLFELYSGGPPLPRMVMPPDQNDRKADTIGASEDSIEVSSTKGDVLPTELDLDAMASTDNADRVMRIPRLMEVETHPWVLNIQLCDPQQPYMKQEHSDAGPMTIRVMASPDQPLWRLYAEIVVRFPFHLFKAYGSNGRGKARLWKRIEQGNPKSSYPPWPCTLVCKNRVAILPARDTDKELQDHFDILKSDWEEYGDHATVQSSGIVDGSQMIVEFAEFNSKGEITWPREAAAKAGLVRRLAEKDMRFRRMLVGLDGHGKPLPKSPELVGMSIDAEDPSGRWYPVNITHVRNIDPDTDEEDDVSVDDTPRVYKQVRVDFTRHGGHPEWIDVESDRLASSGRYTTGKRDDTKEIPPKTQNASSGTQNKSQVQAKKAAQDNSESNAKVCTLPGYGACGLNNMGNTCYLNSALQCISYFPLLRSYLLSGEYRKTGDLNTDNPLGTGGKLLDEFVELLGMMWSAKYGEKSPVKFRHLIAKLRPDVFAGADQQDSQEFLSYVLDALMEDSNRVKVKPYGGALEDDWVKSVPLHTVGEEAWRRDRRRSRSIMTDVVTGQFLSTTTCPTCKYASQKFDIFNLLSLPLPTVADVFFKVIVFRRANSFNTPWVLNKPKHKKAGPRINSRVKPKQPPSDHFVAEQYIIGVSRLADSNDLREKIQSVTGIPFHSLIVCNAEEKVTSNVKDGAVVRRRMDMTVLNNKKGPCGQLAPRQRSMSEDLGATRTAPVMLLAFENTLRNRPRPKTGPDDTSEDNEDDPDDNSDSLEPSEKEAKTLDRLTSKYGNTEECRLYDTEMLPLAKAISRSIWPTCEEELMVGLRVDALDQKNNWCTGSITEMYGPSESNGESKSDEGENEAKVRVHFDNFSYKWDEMYTIEDFKDMRVRPLYSHAPAKTKPTEFIVNHRFTDRVSRVSNLFGQAFYVQCHSEWSIARAGAQILSQASRFLSQKQLAAGPVDIDAPQELESKIEKLYDRTQTIISEMIDYLIDYDRACVVSALGYDSDSNPSSGVKKFRNPGFDYADLSEALLKKMNERLNRLPFEIRVSTMDAPLAVTSKEDVAYPFSLLRNIGNYMGARNCIILQWREPPSDKKAPTSSPGGSSYRSSLGPVMYNPPKVVVDEESAAILTKANQKAKNPASGGRGSAGLPLGHCLSEFCKAQKLGEGDSEAISWRCPRCKVERPGASQKMVLWRLPDILSIHLKRFRSSHKFREKISTKVNFPLTGLDMTEWCHPQSQAVVEENGETCVYDLIGVLNHSGILGGGHYIASCKATPCSKEGREEVAYDFNGAGTTLPTPIEEENGNTSGWKSFGRPKVEANPNKVVAAGVAKSSEESAEPLWLQFDDEFVEPIPPRDVVSEMAYVLFYRRRKLSPANVARYSTLE